MPLINLRTNIPNIHDADGLLKSLSAALASATAKPECYVMTLLEAGIPMTFAGSSEPCAFVEIKSIGSLVPAAMSAQFCELIEASLGISKDRIYLGFHDVSASEWGWDGRTFG